MARSRAANCRSVESLKERTRWGCSLCARQMRCTELMLIAPAAAIAAAVQWVASCGGSVAVSAITRSMIVCSNGGMRDGRVLSRRSPSTPSVMNRSCQRQTLGFDLPLRRMIPAVPRPSAVARMIFARQTCFCGLFRSATTLSRRARSAALTLVLMSLRMPQTRTPNEPWESYVRPGPLGGISLSMSAYAGPSDVQIVDGTCDSSSHTAEGPIGADLTKRRSRFYCDSAVIAFFDDYT